MVIFHTDKKGRLVLMGSLKKYVACYLVFIAFIVAGGYVINSFFGTKKKVNTKESHRVPKRRYIKVPRRECSKMG